MISLKWFVYALLVLATGVWAQSVHLQAADRAVGRGRWHTALNEQLASMRLMSSNFLSRVARAVPLPSGMTNIETTSSYNVTIFEGFADYEYRVSHRVSNVDLVALLSWQYSLTQNERAYNLLRSLPYLTRAPFWWRSQTNRGVITTIWREDNTYYYLRVLEEKENALTRGFMMKIEVFPIRNLSSRMIETFVWDYIIKSDWGSLDRLLR